MKKSRNRLMSWISALTLAGCALIAPNSLQASSNSPQTAIDSNSNRIVVWQTFNSTTSNYEIRSAVLTGSSWQVFPHPISPPTNSQSLVLASNFASGNAIAIWSGIDPTTSNSAIQVALYDASITTWITSLTISSSSENANSDYQATINESGVACVTWSSFNGTDNVIYTATVDLNSIVDRSQLYP